MNKASQMFYKLHGVKVIEVHIVTCARRKNVPTWKRLEAALLNTFRMRYFELPMYNKIRPKADENLFSGNALRKIIDEFSHD